MTVIAGHGLDGLAVGRPFHSAGDDSGCQGLIAEPPQICKVSGNQ